MIRWLKRFFRCKRRLDYEPYKFRDTCTGARWNNFANTYNSTPWKVFDFRVVCVPRIPITAGRRVCSF